MATSFGGQNLTEQQTDIEVAGIRDSKGLEAVFRTLWDRVNKAAELIQHLKEENRALQSRAEGLEEQVSYLKNEVSEKEEALRQIKEQQQQALSRGNSLFSDEEKEALKLKVKELLSRINSHL